MSKLPEKFSAAIRLAVEDMKKCEADPNYVIDMDHWNRVKNGTCHVCMAGAVMAQTYGVSLDMNERDGLEVVPVDLVGVGAEEDKLTSFDLLRKGYFSAAYVDYTDKGFSATGAFKNLPPFFSYEVDRDRFYNWCLAVADAFETMGE